MDPILYYRAFNKSIRGLQRQAKSNVKKNTHTLTAHPLPFKKQLNQDKN